MAKTSGKQLVMKQAMALGNGDREMGMVMGTVTGSAKNIDAESVQPAKGVDVREIEQLLLNPHLYEIVDAGGSSESPATADPKTKTEAPKGEAAKA